MSVRINLNVSLSSNVNKYMNINVCLSSLMSPSGINKNMSQSVSMNVCVSRSKKMNLNESERVYEQAHRYEYSRKC